jgi:signal transduction histidine kinase/DNA-binding response OmpR family regulator
MIRSRPPRPVDESPDGAAANGNLANGLDQSEVRFLVEKNADGIIVVDEDGVVLFANPAAEKLFGRPVAQLVGSPIGIPFIDGDTAEIAIHRPDGTHADAEIRIVETVWNHRPARLATLRDISARRVLEERLRHSAKMEAVGRLTAGIAHDFNNLLTVVLGNLESAQRRTAIADDDTRQSLENATRGARRAATLTGRLLAFARRKPLEPRVVDVNALVSGMSDLLQRTLGETIHVRTTLDQGLWLSAVDPTELEAAILNVAVNARDAMPAGGELLIETANVPLDARYAAANPDAKAGDYVLVAVTDNGSGMPPDVLRQVFDPFFTTKGGRGTGLGLSQVYGFVTQSGGHVKLYSEPNVGTTVRLYLPKSAADSVVIAAAEPKPENAVPCSRPGERILVVEDDDDVRAFTAGSLRELGYQVLEAGDAAAALEILARDSGLHLLFTDLGLPGGVDGSVLSKRAQAMRPSLRVLITTAYAAGALIHDGRLDPGIDLLTKPFTLPAMAMRIREILDRGDGVDGAPRILVVEDEVLVRMYLADCLSDLGFTVEEAGTCREGHEKLAELADGLAAAIVDLGLPDQPGDALVKAIRSVHPSLPILLATGYADQVVHERLAQDSRTQILYKPFDGNGIEAALRRAGLHRRSGR